MHALFIMLVAIVLSSHPPTFVAFGKILPDLDACQTHMVVKTKDMEKFLAEQEKIHPGVSAHVVTTNCVVGSKEKLQSFLDAMKKKGSSPDSIPAIPPKANPKKEQPQHKLVPPKDNGQWI